MRRADLDRLNDGSLSLDNEDGAVDNPTPVTYGSVETGDFVPEPRQEDNMTLKHLNREIEPRIPARPAGQVGAQESCERKANPQVRPEVLKIFNARWKHNESGCLLLSGR